jgi:hypothetical protein
LQNLLRQALLWIGDDASVGRHKAALTKDLSAHTKHQLDRLLQCMPHHSPAREALVNEIVDAAVQAAIDPRTGYLWRHARQEVRAVGTVLGAFGGALGGVMYLGFIKRR